MRGHAALFCGFLPCFLTFLFWKPQWSEIVEGTSRLMAKTVLADEIDMFPSERCDMGEILFRYYFAPLFPVLRPPGTSRLHSRLLSLP
jgi:hypothetical protein